jgi:hypothetical protein
MLKRLTSSIVPGSFPAKLGGGRHWGALWELPRRAIGL